MNDDHIYTRLKVSATWGVKLCLFCKKGVELYDRHCWYVRKDAITFYIQRNMKVNKKQRTVVFHRELLGLKDGEIYDHINGNGLDNRIKANLRPSTPTENACNQRIRTDNTSGIKGVSWDEDKNKWRARINHNGKLYHLGYFTNKQEAERVIRVRREELHKEFANHG